MSLFLASMSPWAKRAKYSRSSSAFKGRGKEPVLPSRRGKQTVLSSSMSHAVIIGNTSYVLLYSPVPVSLS